MKGVVLHGGLGTRLRPLTHTGPKQLLRIAGKPVSQWVLEDLREAGVRDVAIILGNLAPERVVEHYGDGSWLGLNLTYIYQGYPYGLAHAVYLARDFVGDEPFVVYLGDNVILEGITHFAKKFEETDAEAMVLLTEVENPQRFGVAKFQDGRLVGFIEKPKIPPSTLALVGIYFFRSPKVFGVIESLRPSWRGELEITDALQGLIDRGFKVEYGVIRGWWKDTGTPQDILEANRLLLDAKYREKVVKGQVQASSVEGRVYIEEGAAIRNSTVRGPAFIGSGTVIEDSYIGPYTSIGRNCRFTRVEAENSVFMDGVQLEDIPERITDSIIGAEAIIRSNSSKPKGLKIIVGEKSVIEI
ncbi:MAG: glucose-1-phosphate thymidylyltransferase [Thermofilum sp.]|nr:glucose-1-phosphate thymidylyltransferase [Thermofilum sp.]